MSIVIIDPGGLAVKDPADSKVFVFDWDQNNLRTGVAISTSTWTILVVAGDNTTPLTKDSEVKLTAAESTTALGRTVVGDDRATRLRLLAGTLGTLYEIANKIVTNESPSQTKERSFRVLVQDQ